MKTCGLCGGELTDFDRFCGECGGAVVEPEPEMPPSKGALVPLSAALFRRRTVRVLGVLLVFIAVIAIGSEAYLVIARQQAPGAIIRFALNEPSQSWAPAETEAPSETAPSEKPSETQSAQEVTPSESADPSTSPTAQSSQPPITPPVITSGSWVFSTELLQVTKVDPSDTSFELSRQGIGSSETNTQCVTAAIANDPRSSAFPFRPSMSCQPTSFSMQDGHYRANMTCNFPQFGGRKSVDADGVYSGDSVSLSARVKIPAQVVSGDFSKPPEIYLHYKISGRRTGGC